MGFCFFSPKSLGNNRGNLLRCLCVSVYIYTYRYTYVYFRGSFQSMYINCVVCRSSWKEALSVLCISVCVRACVHVCVHVDGGREGQWRTELNRQAAGGRLSCCRPGLRAAGAASCSLCTSWAVWAPAAPHGYCTSSATWPELPPPACPPGGRYVHAYPKEKAWVHVQKYQDQKYTINISPNTVTTELKCAPVTHWSLGVGLRPLKWTTDPTEAWLGLGTY